MSKSIELGTFAEKRDLEKCEKTIEGNLGAFYEMGLAFQEIKKNQLYRACGFNSFDEYLAAKWSEKTSWVYETNL